MPPISRNLAILLFVAVGGCAAGQNPTPTAPTGSVEEQRPVEELLARGREAARRGDAVRAEQYLALAIEQGADRQRVMPMLLRACLSSSHLRAALNYAEPYLLEHPEDDRLRYLVANVHLGLGKVVEAKRELGLLLQRDPRNPDAHYLLGVVDTVADPSHARAHFLQALEQSKDAGQRTEIGSRLAMLALRDSEHDAVHSREAGRGVMASEVDAGDAQ